MIKKIIIIILTALLSLMILAGAVLKITGAKAVAGPLNKLGVGNYLALLAGMEIVFLMLFLLPVTRKIGLLLFSCYFGGAIAAHVSHGESVFSAVPPLVLIWVVAYLKDPSIFYNRDQVLQPSYGRSA